MSTRSTGLAPSAGRTQIIVQPDRSRVAAWGVLLLACALSVAGCTRNTGPPDNDNSSANANSGVDNSGADNGGGPAGLVEVPDPRSGDNPRYPLVSTAPPAAGESVTDAAFGLAQTRVVQAVGLRHEYSRLDPFNRDGSLILLLSVAEGAWRVYRTASLPYDQDAQFVRSLDLAEPRWDPDDADCIWGLRDFQIVAVNVQTGEASVVKDFSQDPAVAPLLAAEPDLFRITMKDEGEAASDLRYWAFMLQGTAQDYRPRHLLTWDRQEGRVLGIWAVPEGESRMDWVGMSPRGNWVLIGADWDNGGGKAGMVIADRQFSLFHQLDYNAGHSDVGLDSAGNEVIVLQSNRTDTVDMVRISADSRPVDTGESYAGTGRTALVRLFSDSASPLNLNSGIHISCNAPGWCVISTFTEPNLPEQNWLDRTIILVRLDPAQPRAFYLAKVHGTAGAYWEETQASLTRDGGRVVWATNWGLDVGQERVWLMQLDIPN